jgi:hypothetical protein
MPDEHHQARVIDNIAGAALVAGDFALSAGWGSTAAAAVIAGSQDKRGHIDITVGGAGIAANPTVTLTFKEPFATAKYMCAADRGDAIVAQTGQWAVTTKTTTTVVFQFIGTPVSAQVIGLEFLIAGG